MIRIPYGKSDYRTMVEENYFYQDRTPFIKTLEDWDSTYLMYLRPRRFGKRKEVVGILEGIEMPNEEIPTTLNDMRLWYDGYLFSNRAPHKLYNSNMVLYFASEYKETKSYPDAMLDPNVASDYSKIQKLFSILPRDSYGEGKEDLYLNVLKDLLENGEVTATLTDQYSFTRGFTQDDLVTHHTHKR